MSKDLVNPDEQRRRRSRQERELEDQEQDQEQEPVLQKPRIQEEEEEEEKEELGFRTPSSSDHKIPVVDRCPPAPRKRRRGNFPERKRRFSDDLRFFEDSGVGREEVESFFGGLSRRQNGAVKRCRSA